VVAKQLFDKKEFSDMIKETIDELERDIAEVGTGRGGRGQSVAFRSSGWR
jgi:hypothetical protein